VPVVNIHAVVIGEVDGEDDAAGLQVEFSLGTLFSRFLFVIALGRTTFTPKA
jgi:hypothetical protein